MSPGSERVSSTSDNPSVVQTLLAGAGIGRRQMARALAALDEGLDRQAVIWRSGLPRKQIEQIWRALGRGSSLANGRLCLQYGFARGGPWRCLAACP